MEPDTPLVIAPDHPAIPGHFPGHPVVPGVLLLAHVHAALVGRCGPLRLTAIPQVKFLAPLAPGEPCTIEFTRTTGREAHFECRTRERVVARGVFRFGRDEHDPD